MLNDTTLLLMLALMLIGLYRAFQVITQSRTDPKVWEGEESTDTRVAERTDEPRTAVDELFHAKVAAEQANRTKTGFLAAASHDLLQPLSAATLFTSLLVQRAQESEPEVAELARRIADSLASAEDIVDAMMDISLLDAKAWRPDVRPVRASDLLESLQRQFFALAAERGIELRVRPSRAVLRSDPQLLRRVLQNFLANAIRYTPYGGRILLGCRRRGGNVEIGVWDTGPGIAPAHQKVVFEAFRRIDDGRGDNRERGLGLGLAIAERISRELKHPLSLQSTPGTGSKFSVLVPRSVGAPCLRMHPVNHEPLNGLTVWCVDNDENVLESMQALLGAWGCAVRVFPSDEMFLAAVMNSEERPAVVFVDYHLRGNRSGLELVTEAAACAGEPLTAIVVTEDRSGKVQHATRAAGYEVLAKPLKPAAIRAVMAGALAPVQSIA